MNPRARGAWIPGVAGVVLSLTAVGCTKEKESLVVVTLNADAADTTAPAMTSVVLTVSDGTHSLSRTFPLTAGKGIPSATPYVTFGVYVGSDLTGGVTVSAKASKTGSCVGESGSKPAKVAAAGDTVPVTVAMKPSADVCPADGGAGSGGAAGSTGSGGGAGGGGQTGSCGPTGSGGRPAIVAPPTFSNCVEFSGYDAPGVTCDVTNDNYDAAVVALAFSPDGRFLATGGVTDFGDDDHVRIWSFDGTTLTPCGPSLPTFGFPYVAFSPDGRTLAVASADDYLYLYDVPSWTLKTTITSVGSDFLSGVGFTPDGKSVISIGYNSGTASGDVFIDGLDGTHYTSMPISQDVDALAVSPVANGNTARFAVVDYNGGVGVYAATMGTGATVTSTASVLQNTGGIPAFAVAFSVDGTLLAAGSEDGTAAFWTISAQGAAQPTGAAITANDPSTYVNGLSFSPDGASIAVAIGGDNTEANLYSVASRAFLAGFLAPVFVESIAFAPSQGAVVGGEFSCGQVLLCVH